MIKVEPSSPVVRKPYNAVLMMVFEDGTYLCLEPDGIWRRYPEYPTNVKVGPGGTPGTEWDAAKASKMFADCFDLSTAAGTASNVFFHGDVSKGKLSIPFKFNVTEEEK